MQFVRRLVFISILIQSTAILASDSAPLGSPDFRPSQAHPFGFRGDGSGRFPGATPPTEWSAKKNIRWSTAVGRSYSSPILTDKCVLVTSEPNVLLCLDRANGQILWKVESNPADLPDEKSRKGAADYEAPKNGSGMAAATPVTDGKFVYVVFANGIVRAIDLSGKPQWAAYIDAEQSTGYGRSSSPILCGGKLVVHMTNLYAFDPANGKQLWVNTDATSQYGSPTSFKLGDADLIVTPNGDVVRADNGKSAATGIGLGHNSSPVVSDGVIYFDENAVNATRLNAAFKGEELWSASIMGDVFGSPLIDEPRPQGSGLLFTATGKGELFAFDTKGKGDQDPVINARALFGENEGGPIAYASVTLAGKYLFLNSNQGDTVVLEATREAKQIAKNTLAAGSGASPVFSGKDMYLRAGEKLLCIGE
ncbi:MAG TPA: PQQ-binding-like beta-propeller repeat protein [Planctomycetota bacterium]|nr:PQQ-binding-like beta-propeller repeat protein [Planctomycetota bacterium]